eukprot:2269982-Pleurochrysis_carterae.AAC.3
MYSNPTVCCLLQAPATSHVLPQTAASRRQFGCSLTATGTAGVVAAVCTHPPAWPPTPRTQPSTAVRLRHRHTCPIHHALTVALLTPLLPTCRDSHSASRTFYAHSIPAEASSTAADVEARAFTAQQALTHLRAQYRQRCLGNPIVKQNIRASCQRYKHKHEPRRGRRAAHLAADAAAVAAAAPTMQLR